jgi:two-component system sensor histidine kinase/response regulator
VGIALFSLLMLLLALAGLQINQRSVQQRLKDEALAESESRFRTLIRDMGVGVLLLNSRAEILVANRAARQFLQLPQTIEAGSVFGQQGILLQENGCPFTLDQLPIQRAITQGIPINDAVLGVSGAANGSVRWLLVNVDPQRGATGQVEQVVCTFSDITIQKQAEAAVQAVANRETAIIRIVQRMRQTLDLETIFAATTQELKQAVNCDRVWIYRFQSDWSGAVVAEALANPADPSTLGATEQQLIDRADCGARQMQGEILDDSYLIVEDTYLQETQAETYRHDRTYHCVSDTHAQGFDPCYLEFLDQWQVRAYVIVPIFAGGQLWGLLGIYGHHQPRVWTRHEVKMVRQVGVHLGTAVQQADLLRQTQQQAQALEVAKQTADAANQAKSHFLASMSHELRTPLNAILGFTQILHRDDNLARPHRDLVAIVNRSGNHLLGLINDVLSLAKIEANRVTLDEGPFDLGQLLQILDDMLQIKAKTRGITLGIETAYLNGQKLWADHGKLRQILINLIGNAIKFTPQGTVTVRWSLTGPPLGQGQAPGDSPKTHHLIITVEDTGMGIAPDELPHLFQPFEQTQSGRRAAEGTGLGLSLSYNFAQLMGGNLTVASQPEQGSTFTLSLPVGIVKVDVPAQLTTDGIITHLAKHQGNRRILVVDDVAESRMLLRHWLEEVGFEVREASNGKQAIEVWQDWPPDLICLDMRMPKLDGYGVARYIRQKTGDAGPVILAVTASVFEEQQEDCLAAGCNAVLPKPIQRDQLLEQVADHLDLLYDYTYGAALAHQLALGLDRHSDQRLLEDNQPLTQAHFREVNPEWLMQVHQAAQAADDHHLYQLITQLPSSQQYLGEQLTQLINDFRLDKIIDLTAPSSVISSTPHNAPV